eukprot:gene22957-27937_t
MEPITADFGTLRDPEYQAVIIVEYDDGRLFPLTESIPRCLLPIANKPLISYQLDMLASSNIAETYIVVPSDYKTAFERFLSDYLRDNMSIDLVVAEDMTGGCDGIRAVSERLRGDVIVLHADLICQFSLAALVTLHRTSMADITMMLAQVPKDFHREDIDTYYFGMSPDGRVHFKLSALELTELSSSLDLHKSTFSHTNTLRIRKDIQDMYVYVCKPWIVEYILRQTRVTSIHQDVIPAILKRQFMSKDYVYGYFPEVQHRDEEDVGSVEKWVAGGKKGSIFDASSDDHLRVYGLVYELYAQTYTPSPLLQRITSIPAYIALNREMGVVGGSGLSMPWGRLPNYLKKEMSFVGENTDLSDKSITVKQCSLGCNVKIGSKSKLNNCVVMDNVVIGENCIMQNSVLCERSVVESNVNINECYVGASYKVQQGVKVKGESFSSNPIDHY